VSNQYWFAKLASRGAGGPRMAPVTREGWLVVAGFITGMAVGGILFLTLMLSDHVAPAVIVFAAVAIASGGGFLWASVAKGDTTRTVADYRTMRKGRPR
jgi:hypothetical protein